MIKILSADELAQKTAKGTISTVYGLPDSGKSTFMVTVAEKMKVLYIDAEGKFGKICSNVDGFEKFKSNISGIEVKTLHDLIKIVKDPMINEFDAVIIDSVTQLVDKELHDIMFVQNRRRTFDDYNDLGTNFMGAIEILKEKGISTFFTIQAKETNGYSEPDAQGGLVAKKAIESSDWMFFIEEGDKGERVMSIKNSLDCRLKKKGIPNEFSDQLVGDEVKFSSLWDVFPSKPEAPKEIKLATKTQVSKINALIAAGNKLEKLNMDVLHEHLGVKTDKYEELNTEVAKEMIDLLVQRNKDIADAKRIDAKKDA